MRIHKVKLVYFAAFFTPLLTYGNSYQNTGNNISNLSFPQSNKTQKSAQTIRKKNNLSRLGLELLEYSHLESKKVGHTLQQLQPDLRPEKFQNKERKESYVHNPLVEKQYRETFNSSNGYFYRSQ